MIKQNYSKRWPNSPSLLLFVKANGNSVRRYINFFGALALVSLLALVRKLWRKIYHFNNDSNCVHTSDVVGVLDWFLSFVIPI